MASRSRSRWRGERHAAVLVVRIYRDGATIDSDCAILHRADDGSWLEPGSWGGGPWIDDPFTRSPDGWDGDHVLWMSRRSLVDWPDDPVEKPRQPEGIRIVANDVTVAGKTSRQSIESQSGAFIVGIEGPGEATTQPVDADGCPVGPAESA